MPESEVGLQRIPKQDSFAKNFVRRAKLMFWTRIHIKNKTCSQKKIETFTKNPPPPPSQGGTTKNQLWAVIEGTPFLLICTQKFPKILRLISLGDNLVLFRSKTEKRSIHRQIFTKKVHKRTRKSAPTRKKNLPVTESPCRNSSSRQT